MIKGFGPGGPGPDPDDTVTVGGGNVNAGATVAEIAREYSPWLYDRDADEPLRLRLERLVAEGVQMLEHASLLRAQFHHGDYSLDYAPTRLGRAALERTAVERILDSGSI